MNIEDNIKIQQAFVQARIEYAAAEEERQKKIKEKNTASLPGLSGVRLFHYVLCMCRFIQALKHIVIRIMRHDTFRIVAQYIP